MKMLDLIQAYRNKLQTNPHDISCLLFALQIPSVCSRIDFPQTPENTGKCKDGKFYRANGKTWDANMYKAWLRKHCSHFVDIYSISMTKGYVILMDIDGNKIDFSTIPRGYKTPKLINCKRITARSTIMTQVKVV